MNESCNISEDASASNGAETLGKKPHTQTYTPEDQTMRVKQFLSFILSNTYITPEIGAQIPDLKLAADSIFKHTSELLKARI